jgi:Na+/pantothenate symporter
MGMRGVLGSAFLCRFVLCVYFKLNSSDEATSCVIVMLMSPFKTLVAHADRIVHAQQLAFEAEKMIGNQTNKLLMW